MTLVASAMAALLHRRASHIAISSSSMRWTLCSRSTPGPPRTSFWKRSVDISSPRVAYSVSTAARRDELEYFTAEDAESAETRQKKSSLRNPGNQEEEKSMI